MLLRGRLAEGGTEPLWADGDTEALLPSAARGARFFAVAEAPAFATFLPDIAWREGARCAVFLRFDFLASAAIQISPRRMLSERWCTALHLETLPIGQKRLVGVDPAGTQPKLWELAS
jgi:hypothetical protein